MASQNIVRIEQVGDCVQQVVDDLNAKLWAMNQRGHFIEMPEEIGFEMIVLKEWEALESSDRELSESTETQGGFTAETQKSSGSDSQTGNDTKSSRATGLRNESGTSTRVFKQA